VGALPVKRTLRVNYKILKRRTSKFMSPVYNRVASYDIVQCNENINKNFINTYDYAKRNTKIIMYRRAKMIAKNQNEIIDRSVSIISDNTINELLYLLKVYHLTNDNINSYMYILSYEIIWVGYKLLRVNTNDKMIDDKKQSNMDVNLLYQQVIINIILYILIKNMIMNSIINVLNNH
tara:strand:+ start:405 stop:938 length:534 start_codon:yes stop_codon:yes gene_type:complete